MGSSTSAPEALAKKPWHRTWQLLHPRQPRKIGERSVITRQCWCPRSAGSAACFQKLQSLSVQEALCFLLLLGTGGEAGRRPEASSGITGTPDGGGNPRRPPGPESGTETVQNGTTEFNQSLSHGSVGLTSQYFISLKTKLLKWKYFP